MKYHAKRIQTEYISPLTPENSAILFFQYQTGLLLQLKELGLLTEMQYRNCEDCLLQNNKLSRGDRF